ncbi:MAG: sodium:solute symporter family transporter [Sedimentisphaerales bacterium]
MSTGFNWLDYTVLIGYIFFIMIIASLFVKEQHNLTDFFMASRKMPWLAVGCSILATLLSAISITGMPAEFWENGFKMFWGSFIMLPAVLVVIFLFVKIYSRLNIITAYEYLEKRFSLSVRLVGSALFMLYRGSYLGIVIYASAVVLQPALGGNIDILWLMIGFGAFSCIYAVLGGMKAVIWTDVIQLIVIYSGLIWMTISMISHIDGGLIGAWEIAAENGKDFSYMGGSKFWSFNFFEQTTFWGVMLLYFCSELASDGTDQLTVQRYLTTGSMKASANSLWSYVIMAFPVIIFLWLVSLALFAFYKQHPDSLGESIKPDGLLPYYIATQVPHGISGIFIAAIVAAVLSTVDSGMNCLATAAMTDFHLRLSKTRLNDTQSVRWARIWTIFWGIITTGFAILIFLTARENIARTASSVMGLFAGPLLGVFLLGVLTNRVNTQGVSIGAVLGVAIALWACFGWTRLGDDGQVVHISCAWPIVIGTASTCLIGFATSWFFPAPTKDKLIGLTCWNDQ